MANTPTEFANGTQAATVTTEHTLNDNTTVAGVFILNVDRVNMAAGDTVELRIYRKVPVSGTLRVVYSNSFSGAASADNVIATSVPCETPASGEIKFTLKQTVGTGRSFPWSIDQL